MVVKRIKMQIMNHPSGSAPTELSAVEGCGSGVPDDFSTATTDLSGPVFALESPATSRPAETL